MSVYTIDQLSRISGFNKILIRTWENRYKLFHPQRTKTNIRLYGDECLIRALNTGILRDRGYKISHISKLSDQEIKSLVYNSDEIISSNVVEYTNRIIEAGITFDEALFTEYVHKAIAEFGLLEVYNTIFLPTLERIGILWLTNNIMPSQEHFISELVKQTIVSNISLNNKTPDSAPSWLVFLPENEHHEIALLLAKYILKENRQRKFVCITNTFRNTNIADTNVLEDDKLGIISKINDNEIRTMDDLRKILYKYKNSYYDIEFENGKKIILSDIDGEARIIDKEILEEYSIFPTEFSKKWLI